VHRQESCACPPLLPATVEPPRPMAGAPPSPVMPPVGTGAEPLPPATVEPPRPIAGAPPSPVMPPVRTGAEPLLPLPAGSSPMVAPSSLSAEDRQFMFATRENEINTRIQLSFGFMENPFMQPSRHGQHTETMPSSDDFGPGLPAHHDIIGAMAPDRLGKETSRTNPLVGPHSCTGRAPRGTSSSFSMPHLASVCLIGGSVIYVPWRRLPRNCPVGATRRSSARR
jgi:hypothetical protein